MVNCYVGKDCCYEHLTANRSKGYGKDTGMLKVLIADDEEKICQLILKLVDWENLGLQVVATASNGLSAIKEAMEHKPEIIITDIRMPGIDGMELIARIKEHSPDTEIIIISGYRHFEYAQTAIRYGVRNYLLKPIRKEELRDTLIKIVAIYKEKHEQLSFEERVRLVLKNDAGRLRTSFISQIIYSSLHQETSQSMSVVNSQYHFHFREGLFQVIGIKFDNIGHDDSNLTFLANKATDLTAQLLATDCFDYEIYVECSTTYILMNYNEDALKNVRRGIRQMLDALKTLESIIQEIEITIGVGEAAPWNRGHQIRSSLSQARFMLHQRIINGTGRVIETIDFQQHNDHFINSDDFHRFNKDFERALESLNVVEMRTVIYCLMEQLQGTPEVTGYEVLQLSKEVCNLYLFYMKNKKINIENEKKFMDTFNQSADDCPNIQRLFSHLANTICTSFKNAVEVKRSEDNKPIRLAKQYIQDNYQKPITLEEVSAMAGFAPNYFSTLFKKETGVSFLEFLQSARMEAAKKILVTTNDGMHLVCEKVGYGDVKYFTKCFIKYTGLKPGEYRKIYS